MAQFSNIQFADPAVRKARRAAAEKRIEARDEFIALVHAEMANSKDNYDVCYSRVSKRNPAQFANTVEFSNARLAAPWPTFDNVEEVRVPMVDPVYLHAFNLPLDATQGEFAVAWKANDSNGVNNFGKIFEALCNYQQSQRSLAAAAAVNYCKTRYPLIWKEASATA